MIPGTCADPDCTCPEPCDSDACPCPPTLGGIPITLDPELPTDVVELRTADGTVAGVITLKENP